MTGATQKWDAASYEKNARFVSDLGAGPLAWLAPRAGERILDLGCGDGALTVKIKEAGATVVGLDAAPDFVKATAARGLDARLGDAEKLDFSAGFDAVFSNAALHWMTKPVDVIKGARRALKIGGRFVGEMGGQGNVAAICSTLIAVLGAHGMDGAARWPYFYPSAPEYTGLLEANGFRVKQIEHFARPTRLPGSMKDWMKTFAQPFVAGLDEATKEKILSEAEAALRPSLLGADGVWVADYMRLRFFAVAV